MYSAPLDEVLSYEIWICPACESENFWSDKEYIRARSQSHYKDQYKQAKLDDFEQAWLREQAAKDMLDF